MVAKTEEGREVAGYVLAPGDMKPPAFRRVDGVVGWE